MAQKQTNIIAIIIGVFVFLVCLGLGFVIGAGWLEITSCVRISPHFSRSPKTEKVNGAAVQVKGLAPSGLKIILTTTNPETMPFETLNSAALKSGRDFVISDDNGNFEFAGRKMNKNGWRLTITSGEDKYFDQKIELNEGENNLKIETSGDKKVKVFLNDKEIKEGLSVTTSAAKSSTSSTTSTTAAVTTTTTTAPPQAALPATGGEKTKVNANIPPPTSFACDISGKITDKNQQLLSNVNLKIEASDDAIATAVAVANGSYSASLYLSLPSVIVFSAENYKIEGQNSVFCSEQQASQKLDIVIENK